MGVGESTLKQANTPALKYLIDHQVEFEIHTYDYVEKGGTAKSSQALGVPEEQVIKTLIFEDDNKKPMIVLMPGHLQVNTKALAKSLGCKKTQPCQPQIAQKHSGYQVGGTSPFGTRKNMPIYLEKSVQNHERAWINGGSRGLLVSLKVVDLINTLQPKMISVGQAK